MYFSIFFIIKDKIESFILYKEKTLKKSIKKRKQYHCVLILKRNIVQCMMLCFLQCP